MSYLLSSEKSAVHIEEEAIGDYEQIFISIIVRKTLISFFVLLIIIFIFGFISVYLFKYNSPPIRSDGIGYYSYLPALLIYHDISMKTLPLEYKYPQNIVIKSIPETGRYLDKYPIGESILILPFFIISHILTLLARNFVDLSPDGYSMLYQIGAGIAGIFYMILGIYYVKKLLERYFPHKIVYLTLVLILFATNLYHYGTYDSIFSHAFSFLLFSIFLNYVIIWYEKVSSKNSIILGVISGLIILVRPSNIIFLSFFPLWNIRFGFIKEDFRKMINLFWNNRYNILLIRAS